MAAARGLVRMAVPAAVVLLGGCTTLGPDFHAPQVPWLQGWSGGAWRTLADEAPRRAEPRDDEWWRQFDDPVLDQLVAEAQRLNPGVRTAGLRILEARAQLGIAGSALYPQLQQVSSEALVAGNRGSNGQGRTFGSFGLAFDLAWELDFWGKFKRGIESADAAYFSSIAQYDDVQVLVAAQTASLYATIRATELRLRIANENAAIQRRSLEITERLFRSGNDAELDVQQARSQYLGTLATIPEIESSLRQTRNALCVLLARPPDALPELQGGRAKIPEARLEAIVDLPAEMLRRRPDVRAAEMQLAAQSAQIGISEAALYPSIALAGSVGLSATTFGSPGATLAWGLGPALVWNVFDHGRLTNQVLGAGRALPAAVRAVPGRGAARRPRARRCGEQLRLHARRRSASCATRCRPPGARSTSRRSSTAKGWSTSSVCSIRSARCSARRNAWSPARAAWCST